MNTKKNLNLLLTGMFALSTLVSCSNKEEDTITNQEPQALEGLIEQPGDSSHQCSYVDAYWSPTAYLSNSFGTTAETDFIKARLSSIASLWGRPLPQLSFVIDPSNYGSTLNAVAYPTGKIYYGQALYNRAKSQNSNKIACVSVLAHEFGHLLQYSYGLPSVSETTYRADELESDGFSGYYLGKYVGYTANSYNAIASAVDFAALFGDNNVTNVNHHGTAAQRKSAVRLGYLLSNPAITGLNNAVNFDSKFFFYYNRVLSATIKMQISKPDGMTQQGHDLIVSHLDELRKIADGTMTDQEYLNLQ